MVDRLVELVGRAERCFGERFGRPPQWLAAAPGRVNLIGEHTDYNDGYVLPMAIDRYTVVAADRRNGGDDAHRVFSAKKDELIALPRELIEPLPGGSWANYVLGVLALFPGSSEVGPLDLAVDSDVPLGGGLSSSAALEVATATLCEAITGRNLDPWEKVLLCQRAEHEFAGVPCGIMDQFAAVCGEQDHALLLDCRSRQARTIPLDDPAVAVLILESGVRHDLAAGEYARRRASCAEAAGSLQVDSLRSATLETVNAARETLGDMNFRRARHVVTENERTQRAAGKMAARDWSGLGELMFASHASLRDDYEVSCAELDLLVESARRIGPDGGVFGARMTGGGFGGCTVNLVQTSTTAAVIETIKADYQRQTGRELTAYITRPAQGAHQRK